ncbi:flavin reductase family protein [Pseudonocardia nematodicida]|uniref:Flavin reductase family protein n=1 Tax=Pseudonocardia nematodicida TaxID=1206997 RepID=A0ABV1K5M4_9PSEU
MTESLDPDDLSSNRRYRLISGVVVPRPIAWVSTVGEAGGPVNLAPFSCYTFVCYDPLLVAFVAGRKLGGRKDTVVNIVATGDFVVNVADESLAAEVHESAREHPPEVSEADLLDLRTTPSEIVTPPWVERAPISLECRLDRIVEFGNIRSELVVGRVRRVHLRDGLLADGRIETADLEPLARIGGPRYLVGGSVLTLPPVAASPAAPP